MSAKLDRTQWAAAVRQRRGASEPKRFTEQIQKERTARASSMGGKEWAARIEQSRKEVKGGGRQRALSLPSRSKARQRQIGGTLKSNQPKSRPILTEEQRQALPKNGNQVPKKGINASNWTYDHRKTTAARRNGSTLPTGEKKGINAEKWHYDHQKAQAEKKNGTKGRPTSHLSTEKKRTQSKAKTKYQPVRPKRPRQPTARKPTKPATRTPRK